MEPENGSKRFFEMILGLDKQIKDHIVDFDYRMYSLYDLKKLFRRLSKAVKNAVESRGNEAGREKSKNSAIDAINEIQHLLGLNFHKFIEQESKGVVAEEELVKKNEEILKGWEAQQLREYEELQKAGVEGEAGKKVQKIIEEIKKAMAHESVEIEWDRHFSEILDLLRNTIIPEQKSTVQGLYSDLEELKGRIKFLKTLESTERIEEIMNEARIKYENLDRLMRTEKIRVMQPFYKFMRKKRREHGLVKRHLDREGKITKKDILRDVHSFTNSAETQRYMAALMRSWKYLDDEAKRIIPRIGGLSAAAAEKKTKKLEKMAGLAHTDGLTGLKNLRAYQDDIKRWVGEEKLDTTLIIIDIDFFKKFNDTYGHKTGDRVLKFVADTMKEIAGKDFAYRYGGEEFVILLPKIKAVAGKVVAEHVRRHIEEYSRKVMEAVNKEIAIAPEKRRDNITISAGVAGYPEHARNKDELFNKADVALYVAKESGRNQVVVAT